MIKVSHIHQQTFILPYHLQHLLSLQPRSFYYYLFTKFISFLVYSNRQTHKIFNTVPYEIVYVLRQ